MNGMNEKKTVAVIGGGAAGMMAAIHAAYIGAEVTLFEKNDRLGKKLRITGKGRCNVTNDCTTEEFLQNVPTNPRFLYSALSVLSTQDVKDFFEDEGVPLKTERGKRVFPVSDKAQDIVSALVSAFHSRGVKIINEKVRSLVISEEKIKKLQEERLPVYKSLADFTVKTNDNPEITLNEVLKCVF